MIRRFAIRVLNKINRKLSDDVRLDNLFSVTLFPQERLVSYSARTLRYGKVLLVLAWGYFAVCILGLEISDISFSLLKLDTVDDTRLNLIFLVVLAYNLFKFLTLAALDISLIEFSDLDQNRESIFQLARKNHSMAWKIFKEADKKKKPENYDIIKLRQEAFDKLGEASLNDKDYQLFGKRSANISTPDILLPFVSTIIAVGILWVDIVSSNRLEITRFILNIFD